MRSTGTVRRWDGLEGWGVVDSPDTPGGCWVHYSAVRMEGYKDLIPGQAAVFDWEEAEQDGFAFRAHAVWPGDTPEAAAYMSGLLVRCDGTPPPVRVFRADDLAAADPTPGMDRQRAFELPRLWAGQVETAPGAVSGWHHHDLNESTLYVVRGVLRLESEGHGGYVDAGPGDFVHVPAFTVHRESNPLDVPSLAVIVRAGGGVPTVNVDPPS
jgi:uncharacterized RmlC-like cupin family protein/cold shock CspA family protein